MLYGVAELLGLGPILHPLGCEGNIVTRHGEAGAAAVGFFSAAGGQIRSRPAEEPVAGLCGCLGKNGDSCFLILRVGIPVIAPGTAVQVIVHIIARDILGIEVHIAVGNGIGERHLAAGAILVGVPAVEGIGNVAYLLRRGKIADYSEVRRLGGVVLVVVLSCFPFIAAGTAGIPQPVGSGVDILCPNFNGAVHMVTFVLGNLIGMQDNCFYIFLGYRHSK